MDFELIVPILGILVGGLIVLVPLAGLVLRFALKPSIETFIRARQATAAPSEEMRQMEQRLARVEEQLRMLRLERGSSSVSAEL